MKEDSVFCDGILGHQFDKSLLLHAIHSLSTGRFFKENHTLIWF
jgi:hypothetical protein